MGETVEAHIGIAVLSYSKLLDSSGNECVTVYFSPFDFQSVESEYIIEFQLDYSDIYINRVAEAVNNVTEQYRDSYAQAALKELENVLYEEGINDIAQAQVLGTDQDNYEDIALTFPIASSESAEQFPFSYQSYLDGLRTLVKQINSSLNPDLWTMEELFAYLIPSGSSDNDRLRSERATLLKSNGYLNYYQINSYLWEGLYDFYREASLRFYNANIPNESAIGTTEWNSLKATYALAQSFLEAEDNAVYADYCRSVLDEMDRLEKTITGSGYTSVIDQLKAFIQNNYPEVIALDYIYNDEESILAAYAELADSMITAGQGGIYSAVHKVYGDVQQPQRSKHKHFVGTVGRIPL